MRNKQNPQQTQYNEFQDLSDVLSLKKKLMFKMTNTDNVRIKSKKLPPGFFRPNTRQKLQTTSDLPVFEGLKTPSFGGNKKQSFSLSGFSKNKFNLVSFDIEKSRMSTLPVQESEKTYRPKKGQAKRSSLIIKDSQFSSREGNKKELSIRNKRLTLNEEAYQESRKELKMEVERLGQKRRNMANQEQVNFFGKQSLLQPLRSKEKRKKKLLPSII